MDANTFAQLAIWGTAMIFGAGGVYARMDNTSEEVDHLKQEVTYHASMSSHPVGAERMETLMVEQRALRADVTEQGRSLAAICQATGAVCE